MLDARDYLLPRYCPFQPLLILCLFPKPLYGYHGFGDPFDDQFLNPLDENVDPYGIRLPTVTCNAGSNQFDLTKLASAIAQLPNRTLQVKLVFSNGEIQNWHLGKATVQAIKNLLAIRQTLMNSPNLLPTGVTR